MNPIRVCTEQTILARLTERAGTRYQSAQLAAYFGIPTAAMTPILKRLAAAQQIRIVRCGGNPTMYYIPSAKQLEAEARLPKLTSITAVIVPTELANEIFKQASEA